MSFRKLPLYLAVWLALPLLLIEVAMIVFEPYLFRGFYQYDSELGFRVRPGAHGSNEFGFNDRDYRHAKAPGTFRILFVGDSFSWAGGRDGNYTALLERRFEAHHREHKVDVINSGYSMTHTAEQLPLLEKFGLQYSPDLVVLSFTAGNDFYDATPERKRIVVNGLYVDIDPRKEWIVLGYPIIPKSRLWLFVTQQLTIRSELAQGGHELARLGLPMEQAVFSEEMYLQIQGGRMQLCHRQAIRNGVYEANIRRIRGSLEAMKRLLDKRDIDFVISVIPAAFQVDPELQSKIFQKYQLRRQDYELDCVQTRIRQFARELGIPVIDLLPRFRREQKNENHYVYRDGHWNARGNALAAEMLFEELLPRVRTGRGTH